MVLTEKQIEKIKAGSWINASFIIEVQGNDQAHIKKSLEDMMLRLKQESGVEAYEEKYSEISKVKENFLTYNVEIRLIAKDFNVLTHLALLYSPSVVEIYEPKSISINVGDAQNILVDISSVVTSLAHALFIQSGKLRKYEQQEGQKSEKLPR